MFAFLFFAALCASCSASPVLVNYSYSKAVGSGSGTAFSSAATGRITAIRVWEVSNSYIKGIQLCHDDTWDVVIGHKHGDPLELNLFDGEIITQISGKYNPANYIYQLIFVTSHGRNLIVGQPTMTSFNFYPVHQDAELRMLSGRFNSAGITSLGAHWGMVYVKEGNNTNVRVPQLLDLDEGSGLE